MQQAVFWIAFKGGNDLNSFERLLEHTDTQHIRVLEKQFKSNAKEMCIRDRRNTVGLKALPEFSKVSALQFLLRILFQGKQGGRRHPSADRRFRLSITACNFLKVQRVQVPEFI